MKYIKGYFGCLCFWLWLLYTIFGTTHRLQIKQARTLLKIVNILPQTKNCRRTKTGKIKNMDGTLRKFAHFILFFILGIVVFLALLVNLNLAVYGVCGLYVL